LDEFHGVQTSVVDPDSLNPDPDTYPAFQVNPDPDPIQIQGFDEHKLRRTSSTSKTKFINCFLFLWVIFALLDLDPDSQSGSGY
jgi:hypothetical protein